MGSGLTYTRKVTKSKRFDRVAERWEHTVCVDYVIKRNGQQIGTMRLDYGYCEYFARRAWHKGFQKGRRWTVNINGMNQKSFPYAWGKEEALKAIRVALVK